LNDDGWKNGKKNGAELPGRIIPWPAGSFSRPPWNHEKEQANI
jgi:hypothetical protein